MAVGPPSPLCVPCLLVSHYRWSTTNYLSSEVNLIKTLHDNFSSVAMKRWLVGGSAGVPRRT